ncbi:MAG: hypothetical protein M3434_05890 [Gemmatimonadota bacterium]|nr:hypothetical protein [Gemmatimonadota bacterium]
MPVSIRLLRSMRLGAVLLAIGSAAACDNPVGDDDDEPNVESAVVTISGGGSAAQTVTLRRTGGTTPSVTLPVNSSRTITVEWRRPDGSRETRVENGEQQLEVNTSAAPGVTFVRSTSNPAFEGTFTATQAGSRTITIRLYHPEEDHADFPAQPLTLNVQ